MAAGVADPTLLILDDAPATAPPATRRMRRIGWIHQWSQLAYAGATAAAEGLASTGIDAVLVKTHDGIAWMGGVYSHPLAPSSVAQMLGLQATFRAHGVDLGAWVDPRSSASEADAHAEIGLALGSLWVDYEHGYPGFWSGGTPEWLRYRDRLLDRMPGAGVAPDPRQPGREYPLSNLEGFAHFTPQNYWTDFQRPWLEVFEHSRLLWRQDRIGTFEPFIPRDATPADVAAALRYAWQRHAPAVHLWRLPAANLAAFCARLPEEGS